MSVLDYMEIRADSISGTSFLLCLLSGGEVPSPVHGLVCASPPLRAVPDCWHPDLFRDAALEPNVHKKVDLHR